jgi:hypothetical protein
VKERNLRLLLAGLSGLLVFRVLQLFHGDEERRPATVVEAVAPESRAHRETPAASAPAAYALAAPATVRFEDDGNAFAVRKPPAPPAPPPPPPPAPTPRPFVGPLQPPPPAPPAPPPPPPLQVIGTWDDAQGHSVFIAGPSGTRQGREKEVVFAQYRVERITPTSVVVRDLSSNREFPLTVPPVARTR